jgi:hypothetical protein
MPPNWRRECHPREAAQYSSRPRQEGRAARRSPPADEFRRFYGERFGMPQDRTQSSLGSGVIVAADGIVVTNAHVLKVVGATEIRLVLADRREFNAKVLAQDDKSDIAVLRIEGGDGRFPHLEFADSDGIEVGDMVLAIGNPFGVGQTVTSGIISALGRTRVTRSDVQVFTRTPPSIPGNSGGALVDMAGRVVGINTAISAARTASALPFPPLRSGGRSAVSGKIERPWRAPRSSTCPASGRSWNGWRARSSCASTTRAPRPRRACRPATLIINVDGHGGRRAPSPATTRGIGNLAKSRSRAGASARRWRRCCAPRRLPTQRATGGRIRSTA